MKNARWFLLLVSLASAAAAQDIPYFTSDFPPEEFAARRAKVYEAIGEGVALIQGAPAQGAYTRFRQTNEFYYLCGIEVPHAYLLLNGRAKRAMLFLPHRIESREQFEGKTLSFEDADEVRRLSGIDGVASLDTLGVVLASLATGEPRTLWTPFSASEGAAMSRDLATRVIGDLAADPFDGRPSRERSFIALIRGRFPQFEIRDLSPVLDQLRLIKSRRELAVIRKATQLASLAILEAMRSTVPGIYEYELDAVAKYVFYRNGAQGDAYYSLVASGPNAIYPHYNAGKRVMRDGELLLFDYAPDVGYYMSDVTRMWPVNGRFNAWQRELYSFYLATYRAILKRIRPGVTAADIKKEAAKEMREILASSKFSKPVYEKAAREFVEAYEHSANQPRSGLGHWVGMATHDVGRDAGPLRAGMVFTIEPQFRVPEEKIYIRLEDVIFITEKGAEIVTDWLPMEIDDIEKVMRDEGMLQKYPAAKPPADPLRP